MSIMKSAFEKSNITANTKDFVSLDKAQAKARVAKVKAKDAEMRLQAAVDAAESLEEWEQYASMRKRAEKVTKQVAKTEKGEDWTMFRSTETGKICKAPTGALLALVEADFTYNTLRLQWEAEQREEDIMSYDNWKVRSAGEWIEGAGVFQADTVGKEYKKPFEWTNPVTEETHTITNSWQYRQLRDAYKLEGEEPSWGNREDGSWSQTDNLCQAEATLMATGCSQERVNQAIKWTLDCLNSGALYSDFRDDVTDHLIEEGVQASWKMEKVRETETKLAEIKPYFPEEKYDAMLDWATKAGMRARELAWNRVKTDARETGAGYNWKLWQEEGKRLSELLYKAINKFSYKLNGKLDYTRFSKVRSLVMTRYWQVFNANTEDKVWEKAVSASWDTVSLFLNSIFSEWNWERTKSDQHFDSWMKMTDPVIQARALKERWDNDYHEHNQLTELVKEIDAVAEGWVQPEPEPVVEVPTDEGRWADCPEWTDADFGW